MIFQGVTNTPKTEAVTISIIYDIVKQKDLTQEYYLIDKSVLPVELNDNTQKIVLPKHSIALLQIKLPETLY